MTRRVALVTGGGRGIGAAVVRALAADGAAVAFCARDADSVSALQREIEAGGGEALGVVADMADAAAVAAFVAAAADRLGPVDILVNNVGQSPSRNFQRMTDADWLGLLELNLLAAVRCTRAVLPGMRERKWGRVVMVASLSAKHPDAALIDYAAAKAALVATAKALARRYGRDGVLVNSVLPGLIHTPMWDRAAAEIAGARGGSAEDVLASMAAAVPVGRYGEAGEVAAVMRFLVSDAASYVNGAAIDVDGGIGTQSSAMAGERDDDLRRRMRAFIDERVIPRSPCSSATTTHPRRRSSGSRRRPRPRACGRSGIRRRSAAAASASSRFVHLNEIIGRSEWGQLAVGSISMQDAIMLHRYGTDEQRERWLLPMVRGEICPSVALTEPEVAGSDPTLMRRARRADGDEWVIDGHKWFTTGADRAAYTTVFCRTEPDDAPPHRAHDDDHRPDGHARPRDRPPASRRWATSAARTARCGSTACASRWRTRSARAARPSGSRRTGSGRGGSSTPCAGSGRRSGRSS